MPPPTTRHSSRRLGCVAASSLIAGALVLATSPQPADAQQPLVRARKAVILWLDGGTIADWTGPHLPNFAAFLDSASLALLSTRTEDERLDARSLRASAAASVGAGSRSMADPVSGHAVHIDAVTNGVLGEALARGSKRMAVIGDADGAALQDRNAALVLARFDGTVPPIEPMSRESETFPTGRIADLDALRKAIGPALSRVDVVLVDPGDGARVQRELGDDVQEAAPWQRAAFVRADAVLGAIRSAADDETLVVVVSATPPVEVRRLGIRLGVVAIDGPGIAEGLLRSGTTRRAGVVAISDLAPTIADALGVALPAAVDGRVATHERAPDAVARLVDLERGVVHAALARHPLTRQPLIFAMVLVALAVLLLLRARPLPRGVREVLAVGTMACGAIPLALYVEGAFRVSTVGAGRVVVAAFCVVLAVAVRVLLGVRKGLVAIFAATAAVPLADLLLGTPLGVRSPLAFQIAGGGRFYGVDDGILGVIVGGAVMAAGLAARDDNVGSRTLFVVSAGFAAAVWVTGSPSYGSKFGAPLTAVPAFGVVALGIGRRRLTWRASVAIAAATIAITGLVVAADALRAPEAQTHVARAVGGDTDIGALVARKVRATWTITVRTIWSRAIVVLGGALLLLRWRRPELFRRLDRMHRTALVGCAVGVVAGVAFNDGGVITGAPIALVAATGTLPLLLLPEDPPARTGRAGAIRVPSDDGGASLSVVPPADPR